MSEEARPKRRFRRRWWALASVPLVLALGFSLVAFLPHIVTGERIRTEAVSALTSALGAPVEIARVEYHPFSGIEIDGLVIGPPPGFEENVVSIERALVRYELGGIFGRRLIVSELKLIAPVITVETRGGQRNIDVMLAHLSQTSEEPSGAQEIEPGEAGPLLPIDIDLAAIE